MTTLTFDDLPSEEALLEPRRSKGRGMTSEPRLTLGGPFSVPLDANLIDRDDHELRSFMSREAKTHTYWLVRLNCTFRGSQDEPFHKAWVSLKLTRQDGKPEPQPVAWSMRPLSLLQMREIPWSLKIGADAKIVNAEAEWHPKAKIQAAVLAMGELESSAGWDFSVTDSSPLAGIQRLTMVMRTPRDIPTVGELSIDAVIRRRRFGLVPHTARFPGGRTVQFRIPTTLAPSTAELKPSP